MTHSDQLSIHSKSNCCGTLQISADANLGATASPAGVTIDGGTLQTTAGFNTSRSLGLGVNGATIQVGSGTLGISGVVSSSTYSEGYLTPLLEPSL